MVKVVEFWRAFRADEKGATAVEYGLIVAGIGIAVLTGVGTVRDAMISMYNDVIVPALS
ncbi:Flp family type IVb pilin [Parvibaculum sp.]|jgi:pilus assembly protein Flp/PilA|uniref:Flp family type IVb pilin n=1 Tax=Parvibaculum sp. TaxID=2024848 RepID=UPI000C6C2B97|nr:Flp family type IVb pilin [Parvibaculum sp.]HAC56760.1 Flp family type IVb pilin [Rhodobiaceae bacterium]MAU60753.1 Flp family type IVb pilin [Parvibaculum sp.]MBO6669077.1 Flp family type IVb pilin [Parvibaculum sp.]MBO6691858.1 Flp family type IVb pilin [Parvibaculum sp.]MBO6715787.1 Flp family type IVb pilin [Parvibaculum sp.]|tara:strand:+ start:312 stop:488 length:177 start_codon:yes stop_codon:yes gene_type:complete